MRHTDSTTIAHIEEMYQSGHLPVTSVEFAHFLYDMYPGIEEDVLLAGFLAFHVTTQGDTHLDMEMVALQIANGEEFENLAFPGAEEWLHMLVQSDAVCDPGEQGILILEEKRYLYVQKYWFYESQIAQWVRDRIELHEAESHPQIEDLRSKDNAEQNRALEISLRHSFSIISGGPGTGKTHTVFKIILAHIRRAIQEGAVCRIALCAPTGKAAARLIESLMINADQYSLSEAELTLLPTQAQTIHSLLGVNRNGSFKHHKDHKLAYDLIIVDEASMIDVGLMYALTQAISPNSKVLLLGDKDQLSPVEAGSVFGDLCAGLPGAGIEDSDQRLLNDYSTLLRKSYRFKDDSEIKHISDLIIREEGQELQAYLSSKKELFVEWEEGKDALWLYEQHIRPHYQEYVDHNSLEKAFEAFNSQKILSPIRKSRFGVDWLNRYFEQKMKSELAIPVSETWYPGRPILITANDASLQLANGDTGICYFEDGKPVVYFASHSGEFMAIEAERIEKYELAFVSTVHKSQGSEHKKVLLLLPDRENRIISKQLLYTAVTRAQKSILIVGKGDVLLESLKNNVVRYTGLSRKL